MALHQRVMQANMENIEKTMRGISEETFNRAIELVLSADRIYIIGLRGSAPLALVLGMGLHQILHNTTILNSEFGTLADQLLSQSRGACHWHQLHSLCEGYDQMPEVRPECRGQHAGYCR